VSGSSKCSSCGRPIIWAQSQKGKHIPWDPEPNAQRGTHILVPDLHNGKVSYMSRRRLPRDGDNPKLHVCHFATCPYADKHRSKKA
jgi:hypothetical protein